MTEDRQFPLAVVIPSYNHADCLARAVDSVLAQTLRPAEIIVVDDGSTDNTPDLFKTFPAEVTCIRQENKGLSGARNTGIRESTAPWVAFLDADDEWTPDKLEVQFQLAQLASTADLLASDFLHVDPDGSIIDTGLERHSLAMTIVEWRDIGDRSLWVRGRLAEALVQDLILCVCTVVVRRSLLTRIGGFDESLRSAEDLDFYLRALAAGARVAFSTSTLARITQRPKSLSRGNPELMKWRLEVLRRRLAQDSGKTQLASVLREAMVQCRLNLSWAYRSQGDYRFARRCASEALWSPHWLQAAKLYLRTLPILRSIKS